MTELADQKLIAPYVAYTTLKNFLSGFQSAGVPIVIDNSVFGSMSVVPSTAEVLASLSELYRQGQQPTADLHRAVQVVGDDTAWRAFVRETLEKYYSTISDTP